MRRISLSLSRRRRIQAREKELRKLRLAKLAENEKESEKENTFLMRAEEARSRLAEQNFVEMERWALDSQHAVARAHELQAAREEDEAKELEVRRSRRSHSRFLSSDYPVSWFTRSPKELGAVGRDGAPRGVATISLTVTIQ